MYTPNQYFFNRLSSVEKPSIEQRDRLRHLADEGEAMRRAYPHHTQRTEEQAQICEDGIRAQEWLRWYNRND